MASAISTLRESFSPLRYHNFRVYLGEQLGAGGVLGAILLLGAMIMLTKTQSK